MPGSYSVGSEPIVPMLIFNNLLYLVQDLQLILFGNMLRKSESSH